MFEYGPPPDIKVTRVRKDGFKEKNPISVVTNDITIKNQEFIIKILEILMDSKDIREFLKERLFPEEYIKYFAKENMKYFNSHPEDFIESIEELQKFCETLLDVIRNEAPGFEIFHLFEENSSLNLLMYEVKKLLYGPNGIYYSSAWWTARDMFEYLKTSGFKQGRNSIPLYKTEKKKKLIKKMDSVMKNLEYMIKKLVHKKESVQKSREKAKKIKTEFQEQFEEYQKYIQNKTT
jgi:hypothetical protein